MNKAGGIIGLIAGILGVGAALFTLLMGGAGAAFDAVGHDRIIAYGWWGIASAFLVIVFGSVAIFKGAIGAFGLLTFSLIGAVLGGTAVALVLALGFLGGVIAAVGEKKWWPWAGLLAGLVIAVPLQISMGNQGTQEQRVSTTTIERPGDELPAVPAEAPTEEVVAACDSAKALDSVKENFVNTLLLKGGASTYAKMWGVIGEGESIEARLRTDMNRLLPFLTLKDIAQVSSPTECTATLVFGPHTQFPIQAMYTVQILADGSGLRVESAFTLPQSGMAQVNLFQGMQKGLLQQLYERELSEQAAKAAATDTSTPAPDQHPITPSYDCAKAGTKVELMICHNAELAKADAEMAPLYAAALESAEDKRAFKNESMEWLRQRDLCQDENCLAILYRSRKEQLANPNR